ncbi:TPA: 30S ribosomal protein S8 [Candidatus Taylorbacteria bacterium]|nr:30S ribosomal protein S8 [Candidatus Taylorbacteria bacterium]
MVTDPISDLIIRIKNAGPVRKEVVSMPYSKLKHAIAEVLKNHKFITSVESKGKGIETTLEIGIAYDGIKPRINDVERVSKSSRRVYKGATEIASVRNGFGSLILSTSKGIMTDKEARKAKVGGEALFKIW